MTKTGKTLFAVLFLFGMSFHPSAQAAAMWDLNDVTYLFPLPVKATLPVSLRMTDLDPSGAPIISIERLKAAAGDFSVSMNLMPGNMLPRSEGFNAYRELFAVGIRLDPCFRDRFAERCRKQIRIVWQPIDHWREGNPEAVDVAIHTFYDLSDAEFKSLLGEVQDLKTFHHVDTTGLPLGIHPGFSKDRPSEFQRDLRALVIPYITEMRMKRMAVMLLAAFSVGWDLLSIDFADGKRIPVQIFPGKETVQQTMNHAGMKSIGSDGGSGNFTEITAELLTRKLHEPTGRAFKGVIFPLSKTETGDQLHRVFTDSEEALATPAQAKIAFTRATRIENPEKHLPGTVDCLSCHVANSVKTLTGDAKQIADAAPKFRGKYNLQNGSKYYGDSHNLRMLGYLYESLQLGDRVIYESASVADALNRPGSR